MTDPILKWAGGKRWLVKRYPEIFSIRHERYVEPFLGSGAVYFHVKPEKALLADKNTELINLYSCIKDIPGELLTEMTRHARLHCKEYYYNVRSARPNTRLGRASRFLYLNRTCWNGLYRENRKGEFNVPIGTKDTVLFKNESFLEASELLAGAVLSSGDFSGVIEECMEGDLVFVDPPYTVKHNNNGFLKYNEQIFSWSDQVRLAAAVQRASERGANIIVTNACHRSVLDLYFSFTDHIFPVTRQSVLAGKSDARGNFDEAIILIGRGTYPSAEGLARMSIDRLSREKATTAPLPLIS